MSPIKKECLVNEDEAYVIWHTNPVKTLVSPIMRCLNREYQSIYPSSNLDGVVFETSKSYRVATINPIIRIAELKIYIDEDLYQEHLTKVHITVDHDTHIEHFQEYVNAIRRTLHNI